MDINQSRRLFSHQIIEEFMLSANKAVAEYLQKHKTPSLYRVHDPPKEESLKLLESFIKNRDGNATLSEPDLHKKISSLIQQFAQHPLSAVVQILILRSLSQAVYSSRNKKHFGLNVKNYTHFTSPIRRYSDLIVHRILKEALNRRAPPYSAPDLTHISHIISACEQRSVKAERQIKDIKRARFIKKYLGEQMEGVICSCVRFGFFVKLRMFDIEGLVHINSLQGQWRFEESLLELYSPATGGRFKMGDFVTIQVIASNIETGQVDFELKAHEGKQVKKLQRQRRQNKKKTKTGNKRRKKSRRAPVSKREKKGRKRK